MRRTATKRQISTIKLIRHTVKIKSPVLSVLVLPACGKGEGEAGDEEEKEDDRHHDHQHLGLEDDD